MDKKELELFLELNTEEILNSLLYFLRQNKKHYKLLSLSMVESLIYELLEDTFEFMPYINLTYFSKEIFKKIEIRGVYKKYENI